MELEEAQEVIKDMLDTAVKDAANISNRIKDLKADYEKDPYITTEAMIRKLETRLEKRTREAKALGVVASSF